MAGSRLRPAYSGYPCPAGARLPPEAGSIPPIPSASSVWARRRAGRAFSRREERMNEIKTELADFGAVVQGWPLDDIPEALRTLNVCLAAVRRSGWALRDVPAKMGRVDY